MHLPAEVNHGSRPARAPVPPPPPPPREQVDPAVRAPALHQGKPDAPPPQTYVQHEVERGETLTEVSRRYQTTVPMLEAANPQIADPDVIDVGQKINVPIGPGYGAEPTREVVEPGQTLTEMARSHPGVSVGDIAGANRHEIPNANLIHPGQEVWVPAQKALTPLEQKTQATDEAMTTARKAEQAYDELPSDANPATRLRLHENRENARADLEAAASAELDARARAGLPPGQQPAESDYQRAGQEIQARYKSDDGETKQLKQALDALAGDRRQAAVDKEAADIVAQARKESDPGKAVQALDEGLKNASPEVKAAALASADGRALIQAAADWATEPMGDKGIAGDTPMWNGLDGPLEGEQAMERLDQVTKGLSPGMAAAVVDKSLPAFETYAKACEEHFGHSGVVGAREMTSALNVLERSLDTPQGQANMDRMLKAGIWNAQAMVDHIGNGGRPDYALAYGRQAPDSVPYGDPADTAQRVIDAGMERFRGKVEEDARAYAGHMEEIGWLIQNQGGAMTPQQLEKAIADYTKKQGPEWEAKGKDLQKQLAQDGEKLLAQMAALGQGANNPATQDASIEALKKTLQDPVAQSAIHAAFQANPDITQGPLGQKLLDFLINPNLSGPAKLANRSVWLGQDFATAYVKSSVLALAGSGTVDPNKPETIQRAKDELAKMRDSRFAKLIGVSPEQMNKAIDAVEDAALRPGDTGSVAKRLKDLDETLDGIKGLEKTTLPGQLVRAAGIGLAGAGLLASTGKAIDDPSWANIFRVVSDSAGLAWRGADIAVGRGALNADSALGKLGGSVFMKFTSGLGAFVDAFAAADALAKGDPESAAFFTAQGAGMLMATFAAGGPVGWIGLGLMVGGALGQWAWNEHKAHSTHEPRWDDGRSMEFLQHAGIKEEAARTLCDQSGAGHSVVPLLAKYAQTQGLDLNQAGDQQKFADWINGMETGELEELKGRLHGTANRLEGDADKFGATAADDGSYKSSVTNYYPYPYSAPTGNVTSHPSPMSAVQLEKVLEELGVKPL
ncbi:MAG: LysM peptidoglycan-binding domain-containing protein [Ottowia sp.]|uniref:LysM peptidoglycan-binding domain-containing protein n=1 Tax=Ottowia sp. TaxID=1898956 RepID=UPI0039E5954F